MFLFSFHPPPENPSESNISSPTPCRTHHISTNSQTTVLCRHTQRAPIQLSYMPKLLQPYFPHDTLHNPLSHMPLPLTLLLLLLIPSSIHNPLVSSLAHSTIPTTHLKLLLSSHPAEPSSISSWLAPYAYHAPFPLPFAFLRKLTPPPPSPPSL